MTKPKHRLAKFRHPGKCSASPPRTASLWPSCSAEVFYGQLGGIGVASGAIAVPIMFGGVALAQEFRWTCRARPVPHGQRPSALLGSPVVGSA